MARLEQVPNPYPGREYWVTIESAEYTSICPLTGYPDFATIRVEYMPDAACVELKSFKLYLASFRDQKIYMEAVPNRILDDLVSACAPLKANVKVDFNVRGGMRLSVTAHHERAAA